MILLAAVLVLVAVGLLILGLAEGSTALQWSAFAVSALAALMLGAAELYRRRAAGSDDAPATAARRSAGPAGRAQAAAQPAEVTPATAPPTDAAWAEPRPADAPAADAAWAEMTSGDAFRADALRADALRDEALRDEASPAEEPWADAPTTVAGATQRPATELPRTELPPVGLPSGPPMTGPDGEPPVEEVEFTDLLLVLDLADEVFVIDQHPRYHLGGCPHLAGQETFPLPMDEARTDGFSPCGTCCPDRHLAQRERSRQAGSGS